MTCSNLKIINLKISFEAYINVFIKKNRRKYNIYHNDKYRLLFIVGVFSKKKYSHNLIYGFL